MRSQILLSPPYHYRSKVSYLFGLLGVLLAVGMCALRIRNDGISALATDCWLWYFLAYAVLYCLVYPKISVDTEQVTITNPFVTSKVSYNRIVGLDSQYQLSLTTSRHKYRALGAPASGVIGSETHRALMTDMGGAVYRGESLMQVSDGGVAGQAGRMIAGYLGELEQSGKLGQMPEVEKRRPDLIGGGIFVLLLLLTIIL